MAVEFDLVDRALDVDRHAAGERDRAPFQAHDPDLERRRLRDRGIDACEHVERVQDVVDAGQGGHHGIREGDQADVERSDPRADACVQNVPRGMNEPFLARIALTGKVSNP